MIKVNTDAFLSLILGLLQQVLLPEISATKLFFLLPVYILNICNTVEEAEAATFLEGLKCSLTHDCRNIVMEADCQVDINAVKSNHQDMSTSYMLFSQSKMIKSMCVSCVCFKVERSSNCVAHELASLARVSDIFEIWVGSVLDSVYAVYPNDFVKLSSIYK